MQVGIVKLNAWLTATYAINGLADLLLYNGNARDPWAVFRSHMTNAKVAKVEIEGQGAGERNSRMATFRKIESGALEVRSNL